MRKKKTAAGKKKKKKHAQRCEWLGTGKRGGHFKLLPLGHGKTYSSN
jgi:hypothetical protein